MNVNEIKSIIKKIPRLFFGFSLCALGSLMMIYTDLGMNSWGILHKGISIQTGLTFGNSYKDTQIIVKEKILLLIQ
ncbi:hypothetical protein IZY60_06320 [Lutibacter sp. B2]|nr:hypothetical protein [Lutibacter sp. B2]